MAEDIKILERCKKLGALRATTDSTITLRKKRAPPSLPQQSRGKQNR